MPPAGRRADGGKVFANGHFWLSLGFRIACVLGAGKFGGKRGDHPVWLRLLRGVPWLLWEGLGCC